MASAKKTAKRTSRAKKVATPIVPPQPKNVVVTISLNVNTAAMLLQELSAGAGFWEGKAGGANPESDWRAKLAVEVRRCIVSSTEQV